MARRFLNLGIWVDADAGTPIATGGEPMSALAYLHSGQADVRLGGKKIGACAECILIGELTCFDGAPATASVILTAPARYFVIATKALNRLCDADSDLCIVLESVITQDMRKKFATINKQLSTKPD